LAVPQCFAGQYRTDCGGLAMRGWDGVIARSGGRAGNRRRWR
jgi:hypothetical protein